MNSPAITLGEPQRGRPFGGGGVFGNGGVLAFSPHQLVYRDPGYPNRSAKSQKRDFRKRGINLPGYLLRIRQDLKIGPDRIFPRFSEIRHPSGKGPAPVPQDSLRPCVLRVCISARKKVLENCRERQPGGITPPSFPAWPVSRT